jgi:hexosaminidase
VSNAPLIISDYSRYSHRGMLIDTSRHYLSVNQIKRMIDTLPINKFNKLHWHIVDAQSFPLDTPSMPTMVKGAYSPSMTYSVTDLKELSEYAYSLGVEIIFEVDVPGHAASW